jgi:hypothetical protein
MLDIIPYKLKLYKYKDGIFDNIIDATYIIYTLGNNNRYNNIKEELNKIKPSKKVYILENKGWRKSKKKIYITNTSKDLVDCNIHIFKHAKKKNYDNILILEDDYIFDKKLKKNNVIKNIEDFILKKKNKSFSFYLGTIPFIFLPYNLNINRGLINIYTHSIIFSKKYREKVLNYNYKNISCWDVFQNYFNYNKYYYNIPLSYQIIEETENSLNWGVPNIVRKIYLKVAYMLKANKDPIIFFNMWYILSYILIVIIILIIILIVINLLKKK